MSVIDFLVTYMTGVMIDKYDIYFVFTGFIVAFAFYMLYSGKKLPEISAIVKLIETVNTKGGIIVVLWITSMLFFFAGIRLIYWSANMMLDGKLNIDNAMVLSGFNWITGAAFGGAFGAMIKTMTGEPIPPTTQSIPPVTSVTEKTEKTVVSGNGGTH